MPSLRVPAARQARAADACLAALIVAVSTIALVGRAEITGPASVLDWVSVFVMPIPLIWRRDKPVWVFWSVVALAWLFDLAGAESAAGIFAPLLALYTLARHRPKRDLWPAALVLALSFGGSVLAAEMRWEEIFGPLAIIAAIALLGMNLRTRNAYLAGLEERNRTLERERDSEARLAVARERARIAREMHDIVAHNLAVIVALADGAALMTPDSPQRASEAMNQVSATGRQALGEMRRLVGLLRDKDSTASDEGREPQPGFAGIDGLVDQVRSAGLQVSLTQSGVPGEWGPGAGLAVYRMVQEALTNTLKHAGAQATAQVSLTYRANSAEIDVTDNGAGKLAEAKPNAGRHGLTGMAERAAPFRGRVIAGPRDGAGWHVHAELHFEETVP